MNPVLPTFDDLCHSIQLLLLDVDGVLTDGTIWIDSQGQEIKRFHVRDGAAIRRWLESGKQCGIVSGRSSPAVEYRAAELGLSLVRQGIKDKWPMVVQLLAELGLQPRHVCYIGDDLPDLEVVQRVGLGVAVADACSELRESAALITRTPGGQGAVREVVERILQAQQRKQQAA